MVPVGVGNNSTPINVSLLQISQDTTAIGDSDHFHESSKEFDGLSEPLTEDIDFWPWSPTPQAYCDAGNVDAEGDVEVDVGSEDSGEGNDAKIGSK